jgi:hypothetical protein
MDRKGTQLILLELNEVNFDVVAYYAHADRCRFPALASLLDEAQVRTTSEEKYENLEPWIQWPSVHLCQPFAEHGIFRLGDVVGTKGEQLFERLEKAGFKVGAISAMNAENRLQSPAYFVPDPWTKTPSDGTWWSCALTQAISQAVNDNAEAKVTLKSLLQLGLCFLRFARLKNYRVYFGLLFASVSKPWCKALILDLLLHDVHWNLFNSGKPDFSVIFFNAGAHIQHHYFFNSEAVRRRSSQRNPNWYVKDEFDPVADMLAIYDIIVGEYFKRADVEVLLATGLSQKPYDRVKFYYRLRSHAEFLRGLGIEFSAVHPRMTRDFLIEFASELQAQIAEEKLAEVIVEADGVALFGEIDNRGKSLFVTMTYPGEITDATRYAFRGKTAALKSEVSFVAVKNGMHQAEGFAFFTPEIALYAPSNGVHVLNIGKSIMNYFGLTNVIGADRR